jgi:hypothetical protein
MAEWYRVWNIPSTSTECSTDCYNITSPPASPNGSIFDGLTTNLTTVAQVIGFYIEQLRQRLAAKAIIVGAADTIFVVTIKRGPRKDTITITTGSQGAYPLTISYTTPTDSGSAQSYNFSQAIDWLVEILA